MPTIKEIVGNYHDSIGFDIPKTASELAGDMDAILSGSAPSPLLERAKQLDKIAHAIAPLGRSELFQAQLKTSLTTEKTAESLAAKKEEPKVEPKKVEEVKTAAISQEKVDQILSKYAAMEEGAKLIKEAYALGQNAALLHAKEGVESLGIAGHLGNAVKSTSKFITGTGKGAVTGGVAGAALGAAMTKRDEGGKLDKSKLIQNAATGAVLGGAAGHIAQPVGASLSEYAKSLGKGKS